MQIINARLNIDRQKKRYILGWDLKNKRYIFANKYLFL